MQTESIIIFLIIIFIILLLIFRSRHFAKNNNLEYFNNKTNKSNKSNNTLKDWDKLFKKYPQRDNVLICSAGPTLNQLDELKVFLDAEPGFWNNCYIISVKSAINKLDELDLPCDFLVTNLIGNADKINKKSLEKLNSKKIILNFDDDNEIDTSKLQYLLEQADIRLELEMESNVMKCIEENQPNAFDLTEKDGKLTTKWGHVMMELALPTALMLKPKKIITIGWDVKNNQKHWNKKEEFQKCENGNYGDEDVILNFTKYLPDYLEKHYGTRIYKLSKDSSVHLPHYRLAIE